MNQLVLLPVEWSSVRHIDDIEPLKDDDFDVLTKIGELLRKRGKEGRFGVSLLHKHFDLQPGEIMYEETDLANRRLVSKIVSEKAYAQDNVIETMWRFPQGIEAGTVCSVICSYNAGHKSCHIPWGV